MALIARKARRHEKTVRKVGLVGLGTIPSALNSQRGNRLWRVFPGALRSPRGPLLTEDTSKAVLMMILTAAEAALQLEMQFCGEPDAWHWGG